MSRQEDEFWGRQRHQQQAAIALADLLFPDGRGAARVESDMTGVLEAASQRIAELKRQLAETRQYLVVAEGQAKGGPPGWTMVAELVVTHGINKWVMDTDPELRVCIERNNPVGWNWWVYLIKDAVLKGRGRGLATAREAMAAAEAAYQEAIAND